MISFLLCLALLIIGYFVYGDVYKRQVVAGEQEDGCKAEQRKVDAIAAGMGGDGIQAIGRRDDAQDVYKRQFQRRSVRSSMEFYFHFNLIMGRSPGFGSYTSNFPPCSDSLSLRLHSLTV